MKIGIMQPYLFPYIGYWQLIKAVDKFVVYDNIEYTKKGWINRNRYLLNGKDTLFSIPLKSDSDFLNIDQRLISESFIREKLIIQLQNAYIKAPYFLQNFLIIKQIISNKENNLFKYIINSIQILCKYLNINTNIIISSSIDIDHNKLKSQDKVLEICKELKADVYINPIGGRQLYDIEVFKKNDIDLYFIKTNDIVYDQHDHTLIPNLSIIDLLMFNSKETVSSYLNLFILEQESMCFAGKN